MVEDGGSLLCNFMKMVVKGINWPGEHKSPPLS